MNPQLERLQDYPFTKLARLLKQVPLAVRAITDRLHHW